MLSNPGYGALDNPAIDGFVRVAILLMVRNGRGFVANIAVLLGIVAGCAVALMMGKTGFEKAAKAGRFDIVTPLAFGLLTFDPVMVLTMALVMIRVMIAVMTESVGMFLARSDITDRPLTQTEMSACLHTGGLGTLHGGLFNTFRYTRFSQNAGGGRGDVTGVKSHWVCVAAGVIMIVLGLLPRLPWLRCC